MKEIVTAELKARICELFERHDKIVEEQDEYIEQLRKTIKQLQSENTRLQAERDKAALNALEKHLVKPPEHKVHKKYKALGKNYYCSCGVMFVDWENQPTNYCGNCGQKLKEDCNG